MSLSRNRSLRLAVEIMEEESQDPIGYQRYLLFGVLKVSTLYFQGHTIDLQKQEISVHQIYFGY